MSNARRHSDHERLMSQMANAQGADFDLAMQRGDLTPESYQDAVLACTGCSDPNGCEQHLRDGRSEIPVFCRNSDLIRHIAKVTPSLD